MSYSTAVKGYASQIKQVISNDEWIKLYEDNYNSYAFSIASILVRKYNKKFLNLLTSINNSSPSKCNKNVPLSYYDVKTNKIVSFINVVFSKEYDPHSLVGLEQVCPFVCKDVIEKAIELAFDNDKKKELAKDNKFVLKFLKRRKEYTILQFIREFSIIEDNYPERDQKIVAAKIEDDLKPLQLILARGVEDIELWRQMYANGPSSCMTLGGQYSRTWAFMNKSGKIHKHPVDYYAYHPDAIGAYYMKADVVQARALVFDDHNGLFHRGKVYGLDGTASKRLTEALNGQLNMASTQVSDDEWPLSAQFSIPGEYHKAQKDYIMPLPYTDNTVSPITISFDIPTKTFYISDGYVTNAKKYSKEIAQKTLITNGFVAAKSVVASRVCMSCGKSLTEDTGYVTADDGTLFCNSSCSDMFGYIGVYDGNRDIRYRVGGDPEHVRSAHGYYTNQMAALRNNVFPFKYHLYQERTDWASISGGSLVTFKGEYFLIPRGLYHAIHRGRLRGFKINPEEKKAKPFENKEEYYFIEIVEINSDGAEANESAEIDW